MRKEANWEKLPFGTKGIERTLLVLFIALTMTSTAFISIMGAAETGNNNILTVYGTVEDEFGVPSSWFLG